MGDQFYVLASDGKKHGPADLMTLQEWANQGRITPDMQLYDEQGNIYPASSKLHFAGSPSNYPPGYSGPPQPGQPYQGNDPNAGPPTPGTYTPPGATPGYPPMSSGHHYQPGQANPNWSPTGTPNYDPLLMGPGMGSGSGCIAGILTLIGFEMCCNAIPGLLGLVFAIYCLASGKPWAKLMVWFASVCFGLQLIYTVMWRFHGA